MAPWRQGYDYNNLPMGNPQRSRVEHQQQRRYGYDPRLQMLEEQARNFSPHRYEVGTDIYGMPYERRPTQRQRFEVGPGESGVFETDFQHSLFGQPSRAQNPQQFIAPGQEYRPIPHMYDDRRPTQRQRFEVGPGESGMFETDFQHSLFSQPSRAQNRQQFIAPGQEYRPIPCRYEVGTDIHGMYGERRPSQRQRFEVGPGESGVFETDFQHSLFSQPSRAQNPQQFIAPGQEYRPIPRRYEDDTEKHVHGMYDERRPSQRQRFEVGPGKSGVFEADAQHSVFSQPSRAENVSSIKPGQEYRLASRTQDRSNECQYPFQFSEYDKRNSRAEKEQIRLELEQQKREEEERKRRQKEEEARYERKKDEEMRNYNPFGREGCGAARRDAKGNPLADLRQMRSENEGYSPRYDSARESQMVCKDNLYPQPPAQENAYGEKTYARGGHGIFGNPLTDIEKIKRDNYRKELEEHNKEEKRRKQLQRERDRLEEEKEDLRIERECKKMKEEYEAEMRKKREKMQAKMIMEDNFRDEVQKQYNDEKKRKRLQREKKRIEEEKDNLRVERERKKMREEYEEEMRRKKEKNEAKMINDNFRDEVQKQYNDAMKRKQLQQEKERIEEEQDNLRVERERKKMREEYEDEMRRKSEMSAFGSTSPPVPAVQRRMCTRD